MNAISKRLADTLDAARALTAEQQDLLASEMLERVQSLSQPQLDLSAEERAELETELAAARRGELASDADVAAMYAKHGL
jgi:ribosome assembly protein YihI (activator of Der GTPase)